MMRCVLYISPRSRKRFSIISCTFTSVGKQTFAAVFCAHQKDKASNVAPAPNSDKRLTQVMLNILNHLPGLQHGEINPRNTEWRFASYRTSSEVFRKKKSWVSLTFCRWTEHETDLKYLVTSLLNNSLSLSQSHSRLHWRRHTKASAWFLQYICVCLCDFFPEMDSNSNKRWILLPKNTPSFNTSRTWTLFVFWLKNSSFISVVATNTLYSATS